MSNKSTANAHNGQLVLRGSGLDCIANLITDGYVRPVMVDGEQYGSLVDVIAVFKPGVKNPRQYWKDHKRQLLSKDSVGSDSLPTGKNQRYEPDEELSESIGQLKLLARDGKRYKTDVAPLWICVYIAMTINQDFRKRIAKFTAAEIKYRMINVAHGSEWAADTVHEKIEPLGTDDLFDDPFTEMGYKR